MPKRQETVYGILRTADRSLVREIDRTPRVYHDQREAAEACADGETVVRLTLIWNVPEGE